MVGTGVCGPRAHNPRGKECFNLVVTRLRRVKKALTSQTLASTITFVHPQVNRPHVAITMATIL